MYTNMYYYLVLVPDIVVKDLKQTCTLALALANDHGSLWQYPLNHAWVLEATC